MAISVLYSWSDQVVFHDSYCVDCAEIGDVRLMVSDVNVLDKRYFKSPLPS